MKTYILTDKTWYRGKGKFGSFIRPYDFGEPRCCIGNVVQQENWDEYCYLGRPNLPEDLEEKLMADDPRVGTADAVIYKVYQANDEPGPTDTERVANINALTEPFGFRFKFQQD